VAAGSRNRMFDDRIQVKVIALGLPPDSSSGKNFPLSWLQ